MGEAYMGLPASSIRVLPHGFGVDLGGRRRATIPYSISDCASEQASSPRAARFEQVLQQHGDDFIMPTSRNPLSQAIAGAKARQSFDLRLAVLALALCAALYALLVDRAGLVSGLQGVGHALEYAARLIASVEIPFG
jgi:hypothetical protein